MRTILGVLVATLLVVGCAGTTGSAAPASAPASAAPAASPSPSSGFGGVARFWMEGKPATTTVDLVVDGATVSGTAVTDIGDATDLSRGSHIVKLGCAAQQGDWWALGGKTDKTTVHGGKAGDWSAVIVRDGSPQLIGIWLSDDPSNASNCGAWLTAIDFANIDLGNFKNVESGTLVAPPAPAS
jgi:hypothetical protein